MKERIIKHIAEKVAWKSGIVDVGLGAAGALLAALSQKSEDMFEKTREELISHNPYNNHLWLKQYEANEYLFRTSFEYSLFNDNGVLMYKAIGGKNNKLQKIKLYDNDQHLLGELHEKRQLVQNPFSMKAHYDFDAIINKKKAGQIRYTVTRKNRTISLNDNEWIIEEKRSLKSEFTFSSYKIMSKSGNLIAETTEKLSYTFIDYPNENDTVMIILFMLAENAVSIIKSRKNGEYKLT